MGDDFRFVSVFCVELGSIADACGASVYEAFWKNFSLFLVVSTCCLVFSAELGSTADTCSAFVYGAPFSSFCLVQQWVQVYASYGGWSVYGRLSSGNGFSEAMGYELFLATVTLLRRASLCRVSWEYGARFRALKCSGYYSANVV